MCKGGLVARYPRRKSRCPAGDDVGHHCATAMCRPALPTLRLLRSRGRQQDSTRTKEVHDELRTEGRLPVAKGSSRPLVSSLLDGSSQVRRGAVAQASYISTICDAVGTLCDAICRGTPTRPAKFLPHGKKTTRQIAAARGTRTIRMIGMSVALATASHGALWSAFHPGG